MRTNLINDLLIRAFGVLRLFITPLILSTAEYGELGLISAIFLYANFADLGLQVHYEVISGMKPEEIKSEITLLLKKLIPRLFVSGVFLSSVVYLEFHSWPLAFWSFILVFTLNIDTLLQIVLRQQKIYKQLAVALFFQAIILTALVAPMALWQRVVGIIALQAMVPLVSIAINSHTIWNLIKSSHQQVLSHFDQTLWNNKMTFWLLLGQIQMMIWISIDRFFLSRVIPINELGLWNLGNMAGAVLLGYANTWGTLKLPFWKKERLPFFDLKFSLSFFGIYLLGVLGLSLTTRFILTKYDEGLTWNIIWLSVTFFLSFVFICDSYTRSQIKNALDATKWFKQKLLAQFIGGGVIAVLFTSGIAPRPSLCIGIIVSCLMIYCFSFLRIKNYV